MHVNPRHATTRRHHRRIVARDEPPCGICHEPIDYQLPYTHPKSFVLDHVIPVAKGGSDELDNKQPAHKDCNRAKADKLPGEQPPPKPNGVIFVTSRNWTP